MNKTVLVPFFTLKINTECLWSARDTPTVTYMYCTSTICQSWVHHQNRATCCNNNHPPLNNSRTERVVDDTASSMDFTPEQISFPNPGHVLNPPAQMTYSIETPSLFLYYSVTYQPEIWFYGILWCHTEDDLWFLDIKCQEWIIRLQPE